MKNLFLTLTLGLALAVTPAAFAQAKKKDAPKPDAAPAADAKKADAAPTGEAKATKPLPMNARADEIDAAGKSFTQTTLAGKKVKHVITAATEIKQGEAAAKFEDIKVGDTVAGLRIKKNEDGTEYEVVKITKFGAKAPTEKKDAAPAKDAPKKE